MNKTTWLNKLKPKNLVTLVDTKNKTRITAMITRIDENSIELNTGIIVDKMTGQSVDNMYTIGSTK